MKRKIALLGIVLLFLAGLAVLSYPLVSSVVNNVFTRQEAAEFQKQIKLIPDDRQSGLIKQAERYNKSLTENVIISDPFAETASDKLGAKYSEVFNVNENGLICYIDIPKINVYLPVYHGTSEDVLSKYAGHLQNTSIPIGGKSTHAVISAHSAYPGQSFFDYLTDLEDGDEFYIHVLSRTLKYVVDQRKVVLPEETQDLRIVSGKDYVTLITCTPYSINTHRLLVRGKRVPYDDAEYVDIEPPVINADGQCVFFLGSKIPYWAAGCTIAAVAAAAIVLPAIIMRRRKKRRSEVENNV